MDYTVKHLGVVVEQAGREQHVVSLTRSRLKPLHLVSHVNRQRGFTRVYDDHEEDEAQQEPNTPCAIRHSLCDSVAKKLNKLEWSLY